MDHLIGVHGRVIDAMNNMKTDTIDPTRRFVHLDMPVNEREALLVVGFLHGVLSQESRSNSSNSKTGLILEVDFAQGDEYSDEAVGVFCRFLQSTTMLPALHLSGFPTVQLRRLLEALHTNVSVTDLKISYVHEDQGAIGITELFRHKTNFTALRFESCFHFDFAQILLFLRQGSAAHVLQKLEIDDCDIGDGGTHLLVDALVNSNTKYNNLYKLSLTSNEMTANGLKCLSKLDSDALPSLTFLDLGDNRNILDDEFATKLFAQKLLLSPGTTLKRLYLKYCSRQAAGYIIVIKSLESNKTVCVLDVTAMPDTFEDKQRFDDQLLESLPKITTVQELYVESGPFLYMMDENNERAMTAFRKNASLFQVTNRPRRFGTQFSTDARLGPILKRNRQFGKVDALLSGTKATIAAAGTNAMNANSSATAATIPPPCGLWPLVLDKVGQGGEGCSPVFKILRNRLATWVIPSSSSAGNAAGAKKHSRGQGPCSTQADNKKVKQG